MVFLPPSRTQMYRQGGTLPDGQLSLDVTSLSSVGGENPPAEGDFPGSTPGKIVSGSKRADGVSPKAYVDGLGVANIDGLIPPGAVMMWVTLIAPPGWLLCNGAAISRTGYPDLAAALSDGAGGYRFGNGDGTLTFNLPDLKNRFPVGLGNVFTTLGQNEGQAENLRTTVHNHNIPGQPSVASFSNVNEGGSTTIRHPDFVGHAHGGDTGSSMRVGSNHAVPFMTIQFIIKT